jgi:hypothetical protein
MRVALDLEDVLVKNIEPFLEDLNDFVESNHSTARRFSSEDITGWRFDGLRQEFAEIRGWDQNIVDKFMKGDGNGWDGFLNITENTWKENPERIVPMEENVEKKVADLSHRVERGGGKLYVVTARKNVESCLKAKLSSLGIEDHVEELIIKGHKDELDFDVYIDDYPLLYRKIASGAQIMVEKPWNRDQMLSPPHRKVGSIDQAREVINDLD